ncbi:hypothetical protein [Sphingomonas sp. UYP23]
MLHLEGRGNAGPEASGFYPTTAGSSIDLLPSDALGPTEADLTEVQIGMFRADMVKYARNGTPHSRVETFGRVGVYIAANIFLLRVPHRVVRHEIMPECHERFPLAADH